MLNIQPHFVLAMYNINLFSHCNDMYGEARMFMPNYRSLSKCFFFQLLSVFDVEEALSLLRQVIECQEVNWKTLLIYTSSVLICYKGAPPAMSSRCMIRITNFLFPVVYYFEKYFVISIMVVIKWLLQNLSRSCLKMPLTPISKMVLLLDSYWPDKHVMKGHMSFLLISNGLT